MKKLQDFATECGVTDRAIQKHLKKHEEALVGHFERKGPNGTWLDEFAQDYIRGLMIQQPVIVGDVFQQQEIDRLKAENDALKDRLLAIQDRLLDTQEALMLGKEAQLALEASKKETALLEGFIRDAKNEIAELKKEKEEAEERARMAEAPKSRWEKLKEVFK